MGQYRKHMYQCFILILTAGITNAANLGDIANSLKAGYDVERNGIPLQLGSTLMTTFLANITLENIGTIPIPVEGWSLNLCHEKLFHPMFFNISTLQYAGGGLILPGNFTVTHGIGCMFSFTPYTGPNENFKALPIEPGQKVVIPVVASEFSVSKFTTFPNWYLSNATHTNLIPNTMDYENHDFVGHFERDMQYMRFINDYESIVVSPIDRYRGFNFSSKDETDGQILPTPLRVHERPTSSVTVDGSWFIDYDNRQSIQPLAKYLKESIQRQVGLNLHYGDYGNRTAKTIQLWKSAPPSAKYDPEMYTLQINGQFNRIVINGYSEEGIINGIHSLMSLLSGSLTINNMTIEDMPRIRYRGLELDITDNFFGADTIRKVIDIMAMYKLNKLVLVLGADNGWRIEIPRIPELTSIGSRRCHDPSETNCLFSQLGSAPDGSDGGYLTGKQYTDLVEYAKIRNIEIIPHINMAGKARAALKSMAVNYQNTRNASLLLHDPDDQVQYYMSSGLFSDSNVNPCLPNNSTVTFFKVILQALNGYHTKAGTPLKHIHVGGDDTPPVAWLTSTHCRALMHLEKEDFYLELKVNYSMALGKAAEEEGVKLIALDEFFIAWPSILNFQRVRPFMTPFNRERFPNTSETFDVISVSKTFDQLPQGHRAQHMADNNYSVILQPDDYFSLDFAPEPNPNIPGDYNSRRRFINATRVFNFLPDNLCCNYQLDDQGSFGCADINNCLELNNKSNIIGIQASLSTRHIKDERTLFKLLAPRIIPYAERAWHRAEWEGTYKVHPIHFHPMAGPQVDIQVPDLDARDKDWTRVASIIGHKEYPRMTNVVKVIPNLLPPGARKVKANVGGASKDILRVDTSYPGLIPQVQTPGSTAWHNIAPVTDVSTLPHSDFKMRTLIKYRDGGRTHSAVGVEATMPLVYTSYKQDVLTNITKHRRELDLMEQRQMAMSRQREQLRIREMERMNQEFRDQQMAMMQMMAQQQQNQQGSGQSQQGQSGQTGSAQTGQFNSQTGQSTFPGQGQTGFPGRGQTGFPGQGQTGFPGQGQIGFPGQGQSAFPGQGQSAFPGQGQTGNLGGQSRAGQTGGFGSGQSQFPGQGPQTGFPQMGTGVFPG